MRLMNAWTRSGVWVICLLAGWSGWNGAQAALPQGKPPAPRRGLPLETAD